MNVEIKFQLGESIVARMPFVGETKLRFYNHVEELLKSVL
ncbi:hypothetical protein A33Q_1421 [Indibacter alkaliphilus LW1]|uniref:Uncharacterized protein n=1 Tax=Indibacter alkaliphilus (strain CCUG 57479 / KCTC 22604 / LW1) TaxID=1189612 RepID=S2DIE0_INDAL|nr:hypothetical protein A33Q_1421 [Indibacter alkaliphilus LW1]